MTEQHTSTAAPAQPVISTHNLSWIAMVAMAGMCLAALVWAASLNVG